MQDVQRALKLKARREARHQPGQPSSHKGVVSTAFDVASGSSLSSNSLPQHISFPPANTNIQPPLGLSPRAVTEVDFSPSTGLAMSVSLHPVPHSSIDGKLLDWTGAPPDDEKPEKRWTLSISKRKDKERVPASSSIAEQESLYASGSLLRYLFIMID